MTINIVSVALRSVVPWQFLALANVAVNLAFLVVCQSQSNQSVAIGEAIDHFYHHNNSSSSRHHSRYQLRKKPWAHPRSFSFHDGPAATLKGKGRISISNMTCEYLEQPLNHFVPRGQSPTYMQRFCVYNNFVQNWTTAPILFYTGNESPLEQYINNTGLMWETAPDLHAQVVFAEHRYEGNSLPSVSHLPKCMSYSSSAQALEDFVALLEHINPGSQRPVVAFGGSYGGMLCAWLRMKYPSAVAGAIAASAPIWGFPKAAKFSNYAIDDAWKVITRGLLLPYPPTLQQERKWKQESQQPPNDCAHNLRAAWPLIYYMGSLTNGRQALQALFRLCQPIRSIDDAKRLVAWAQGIWFDLAEGSFPYPSSYLPFSLHMGINNLPAWPVQFACWNASQLYQDFGILVDGNVSDVTYNVTYGDDGLVLKVDWDTVTPIQTDLAAEGWLSSKTVSNLLTNVRDAVSIWFNISKDVPCYNVTTGWSSSAASPSNNEYLDDTWLLRNQEPGLALGRQSRRTQQQIMQQQPDTNRSKICHDKIVAEGSWNSLCCNEDLNMFPTLGFGLGQDFLWPPSQPRNSDYPWDNVSNDTSCVDPDGFFGYPPVSDPFSSWLDLYYGGVRIGAHSNIVFSNGLLDPWSAAGVYATGMNPNERDAMLLEYTGPMVQNVTKDGSIIALILEYGGHHTDLMYSDPLDPDCIREARRVERERISLWIDEWRQGQQGLV